MTYKIFKIDIEVKKSKYDVDLGYCRAEIYIGNQENIYYRHVFNLKRHQNIDSYYEILKVTLDSALIEDFKGMLPIWDLEHLDTI